MKTIYEGGVGLIQYVKRLLQARGGFVAGFVVASLLFGSMAAATDIIQKDIRVSYLPLRYYFDDVEKVPPADQQGFTFNGRTYVPLRFMADSVGKSVQYDGSTFSIYVGRRSAPVPDVMAGFKVDGDGVIKTEYFPTNAVTYKGIEMPGAVLITAHSATVGAFPYVTGTKQIPVPAGKTRLKGTLFVPDFFYGQTEERKIAEVSVWNATRNRQLWAQPISAEADHTIPFEVNLDLVTDIKVMIKFYHGEGLAVGADGMLFTQLGISDFRFE